MRSQMDWPTVRLDSCLWNDSDVSKWLSIKLENQMKKAKEHSVILQFQKRVKGPKICILCH